ncbi:MAG: helix-turn-helix domain-containing protein [Kiritimatiellae bacterium]|nr:helix-turn-helix domain-containing protein [Kiritimatiellia bacterium]
MTTENRIQAILIADPVKLAQIDSILTGTHTEAAPSDRRLLTKTEAAKTLGMSRQTIWRMIKEGRLPVIEIRRGQHRIPSAALTSMLQEVNQ